MKGKRFEILLVIGLAVGLFGTIIPFANIFTEEIENIIYFRFVLIAGVLISIFGAANLRGIYQNIIISLGSGIASLLLLSTYNLLCDVCIDTYNYYISTIIIVFAVLFILLIIRLCCNNLSRLMNYLK